MVQSVFHPSMLKLVSTSILARDARREHRINSNSFQQNALISWQGFQYACFYSNKDDAVFGGPLLVNIARRRLTLAENVWETLTFLDYEQTVDDGHNTISMGICSGDGTIHISWDHHCDRLESCTKCLFILKFVARSTYTDCATAPQ
jgi:hypothetical protein